MSYGCYNRKPFKSAQVLHGMSSKTGGHVKILIPFRMATDCQYTKTELGQKDPGCVDCRWKEDSKPQPESNENVKPL